MSTYEDTEPITTGEVLAVTRALIDAASTMSVLVKYGYTTPSGAIRGYTVAKQCRAAADFLEAMYKATKPADILRRAADRIDPPTVPAEPDLTTREGWEATMAALGDVEWEDMPIPSCREQRVGLLAAWKVADLNGHDKDAVLLAQVFTASLVDEA